MAEGPPVHRYAARLDGLLPGAAVTVEFRVRKLNELEPSFVGARMERVETAQSAASSWLVPLRSRCSLCQRDWRCSKSF